MSDKIDIVQALTQTLEDARLSRGEKKALKAVLKDLTPDKHDLARYRHHAFDLAREAVSPDDRAVIEWLEDVVKVLLPRDEANPEGGLAEAYFSPGDECPREIANFIGRARKSADVCVFTITDDRVTDALLKAHRSHIEVRIITDNDKMWDRGSDVRKLSDYGIPVRLDKSDYHMHHKFAVVDGAQVLTGSYNWTRGADKYNEENFVILDHKAIVKAFADEFDKLWDRFA